MPLGSGGRSISATRYLRVLRKLYQGSLKRFAAALYDGGALDKGEVAELRAYLEELEGKEGQ